MEKIKVLYDEKTINKRVKELAKELYQKYGNEEVIFICTLKGAVFFTCDLLKNYKGDSRIEFVKVSSYQGETSTGKISMNLSLSEDSIKNKHVIIIEDIVDTGYTLEFLINYLNNMHPSSLATCTLLEKRCKRERPIYPDYYGFMTEDLFVIGYGLDYDGKYRGLPYIGVIEND